MVSKILITSYYGMYLKYLKNDLHIINSAHWYRVLFSIIKDEKQDNYFK